MAGCIGGDDDEPNDDEDNNDILEFRNLEEVGTVESPGVTKEVEVTVVNTSDGSLSESIFFGVDGEQVDRHNFLPNEPGEEITYSTSFHTSMLDYEESEIEYGYYEHPVDSDVYDQVNYLTDTFKYEPYFEINERVEITEEDIIIEVIETERTGSTARAEANGIFQLYAIEVENVGDEEVSLSFDTFRLSYDGAVVEPDRDLSFDLENGLAYREDINPGLSNTIAVGYDIPKDTEPDYIFMEAGGGLFSDSIEYRIDVSD